MSLLINFELMVVRLGKVSFPPARIAGKKPRDVVKHVSILSFVLAQTVHEVFKFAYQVFLIILSYHLDEHIDTLGFDIITILDEHTLG